MSNLISPATGCMRLPNRRANTTFELELYGEAYFERTGLSEKALAYSQEDFRHRHIVIYEAVGMNSDFGSYLIRSLLSEGRLLYEFVEKTKFGMRPRLIEKPGPTGLITTTTSALSVARPIPVPGGRSMLAEGPTWLHRECRKFWLKDHPQPRGAAIACVQITEVAATETLLPIRTRAKYRRDRCQHERRKNNCRAGGHARDDRGGDQCALPHDNAHC
jgi:hypothetical protein